MTKLIRIPTRDANDSDHLAIMLLVGGIIAFTKEGVAESLTTIWLIMSVIAMITAPLLWLRIPHAKWGGIASSLLMGCIPLLRISEQGFALKSGLIVLAFIVIAFWFYRIDYNHRFPIEADDEF